MTGPASCSGTARSSKVVSDWYQADKTILDPMVTEAAAKYAKEKNITREV